VDEEDVDVVRSEPAEAAVDRGDDGVLRILVGDMELRPDMNLVPPDVLEEASDLALAVPVFVVVGGVDVVDPPVDEGPGQIGIRKGTAAEGNLRDEEARPAEPAQTLVGEAGRFLS
jgi:hypothetical protein